LWLFFLEIDVQQKFGHRTHLVVKLAKFSVGVFWGERAEELLECFYVVHLTKLARLVESVKGVPLCA